MENTNEFNNVNDETVPEVSGINKRSSFLIKLLTITSATVVVLILLVHFVLFFFARPILQPELEKLINKDGKPRYILQFDDLKISFLTATIYANGVMITPAHIDSIPDSSYFKFATSRLVLTNLDFWGLISERKLRASKLVINNPSVDLHKVVDTTRINEDQMFKFNQLHRFFLPIFSEINIDEFMIDNGGFTLNKHHDSGVEKITLSGFNLFFGKFLIDSISHFRENKILFSDSVYIDLDKTIFGFQQPNLELLVDNISVSAINSSVTLNNIIAGNRVDDYKTNFSRTAIDKIKLTGIHWFDIPSRIFRADTLILQDAAIVMNQRRRNKSAGDINIESVGDVFYNVVKPLFDVFSLKQCVIRNLDMEARFPGSNKIKNLNVKKANLVIYNISFDRFNVKERSRFFFIDNFEFALKNQEIVLRNAGTSLKSDSMAVSGISSQIFFKNLKLTPLQKPEQNNDSRMNLHFPDIRIQAHNLKNLILTNKFLLESVNVNKPKISLVLPDSTRADTIEIKENIEVLIRKLNATFPGLAIKEVSIDSADIAFAGMNTFPEQKSGRFSANFQLDSFAINKAGSTDSLKLVYSDYRVSFSNIDLNIGNIHFSGKNAAYHHADSILSTNHLVFVKKPSDSTDIKNKSETRVEIERLSLDKWSPEDLLKKRKLFSSEALISGCNILIKEDSDANDKVEKKDGPAFPFIIDFEHVTFEKGNVTYTNSHDSSLYVRLLNLNFSTDDVKSVRSKFPLRLNNLQFSLDSVDLLKGREITFHSGFTRASTNDSVLLIKSPILLFPSSDQLNTNFWSMSMLSLKGFSFEEFYKKQNIAGDSLIISDPELRFITIPGKADSSGFATKTNRFIKGLTGVFPLIQIRHVRADNGTVALSTVDKPNKPYFFSNGTTLITDGLWIDSTCRVNPYEILFANQHHLKSKWIRYYLPDSIHFLSIDDMVISSDLKTLNTGKVVYSPLPGLGSLLQRRNHQYLKTSAISINGIRFDKMYTDSEIHIDSIFIKPPTVTINNREPSSEKMNGRFMANLKPAFDKLTNRLEIGHISFDHGSVKYFIPENLTDPYFSLYKIGAALNGMSSSPEMQDHLFNSEDIKLGFRGLKFHTSDSLYLFSAAAISLSTADSLIIADSIVMLPLYSRSDFVEKVAFQTDWYDVQLKKLTVTDFDFFRFAENQDVRAEKLKIDKLRGLIYRNKSLPLNPDKKSLLPVCMLKSLPFCLVIDTVKILDSKLLYEEQLKDIDYPGSISFENLNLSIENLTNDTILFKYRKSMNAMISTKLMGKGLLEARLIFPFDSLNDYFRVTGFLKPVSLVDFNPLLNNLAFVYIKDGFNTGADFDFHADNFVSRGMLNFRYSKLKIRLIDKKTLRTNAFDESAASFIANLFVVRTNNPKYGIFRRKGKIYFERDQQKSIFNYLAKSALSGVSATIRGSDEEKKELRITRREIRKLKKKEQE